MLRDVRCVTYCLELVQKSWDAVTAREIEPGKYLITNNYQYRHNTAMTYDPSKSNMEEAQGHAKRVIRRAHKQGSLHLLNEQVDKMVRKKCFKEMGAEEILALENTPNHCTYYNWVHNPNSNSTPFRMISNTSAVSSCTTISTEQLSPTNVLNPQENGIIRFSLFPVPLCGDVSGPITLSMSTLPPPCYAYSSTSGTPQNANTPDCLGKPLSPSEMSRLLRGWKWPC